MSMLCAEKLIINMKCQAYGCQNTMGAIQKEIGLTFHRFPKNDSLRRCWEQAVGGENWTAPQGSVLCSAHFTGDDYHNSGKIFKLNKGAIPSVLTNRERDEHLEQLAANVSKVDIAGSSQSKFSDNRGPSVRGMMSIDCSGDSFLEKDEPRKEEQSAANVSKVDIAGSSQSKFSDNSGPSVRGMMSIDCSGDSVLEKDEPRKERGARVMKKLSQNGEKFLENFDPDRSNREKRKLSRIFGAEGPVKSNAGGKKQPPLYDERGCHIASGRDICDCMNAECPGCHFPCPQCNSSKCGHECRVNRRHTYECIEVEGTDIVLYPEF